MPGFLQLKLVSNLDLVGPRRTEEQQVADDRVLPDPGLGIQLVQQVPAGNNDVPVSVFTFECQFGMQQAITTLAYPSLTTVYSRLFSAI